MILIRFLFNIGPLSRQIFLSYSLLCSFACIKESSRSFVNGFEFNEAFVSRREAVKVTRKFISVLSSCTSVSFQIHRTIFFWLSLNKHICTEISRLDSFMCVSLHENNWINELPSVLVELGGRWEVLVQYEKLLYLFRTMLLVAAAT